MSKKKIDKKHNLEKLKNVSYNDIISLLRQKNGKMSHDIVKATEFKSTKTVILTPQATKALYNIFYYGEDHPINLCEQQAALIGNRFDDICLVKYVIQNILYDPTGMATMNDLCVSQIMDEVSIINENISKSHLIYQDSYGDVDFIGFAHSHPKETNLRPSIHDIKSHKDFVRKFGDFSSIILNPQEKKIICFSEENCVESKLILLSK